MTALLTLADLTLAAQGALLTRGSSGGCPSDQGAQSGVASTSR
jgi:hypothetical protein